MRLYPGYTYDDQGVIQVTDQCATINFDTLKSVLLSRDCAENQARLGQIISKDAPRFLDRTVSMAGNRI